MSRGVVSLLRLLTEAIWISLGHPSDNILVLTVNKEVNNQLRAMIDSYNHNSNIEVSTIYTYFKKFNE